MESLLAEFTPYFADAAKASIGAVMIGLLRPVQQIFDKQQRRINARRDLDTIKTMVEIEAAISDPDPQRRAEFQQHFDGVVSRYRQLHGIQNSLDAVAEEGRAPFNYVDVIAALFAPVVTALLLLGEAADDTETGEILSFAGIASVLSLLIARYGVWRYFRGGITQTLLQIVGSILSMILAIFCVVMIEELLL